MGIKRRHVVIQPSGDFRLIPLTQNQNAVVDAADFEWLTQWHWYAHWCASSRSFYAGRNEKGKTIKMHRVILGCETDEQIDHRDHDTLNNRRSNLRRCTKKENVQNRKRELINTSGFQGVSWHKATNKWQVRIWINGRRAYLGLFTDKTAAARAFDDAAKKFRGSFAYLNFP